ncbi:MAG: hypothetical protein PWP23_2729 [Candidatus Sumerlaeota bacterium]|nr:hypothetical protein [Candidatus Sumerlaeota bacterium]
MDENPMTRLSPQPFHSLCDFSPMAPDPSTPHGNRPMATPIVNAVNDESFSFEVLRQLTAGETDGYTCHRDDNPTVRQVVSLTYLNAGDQRGCAGSPRPVARQQPSPCHDFSMAGPSRDRALRQRTCHARSGIERRERRKCVDTALAIWAYRQALAWLRNEKHERENKSTVRSTGQGHQGIGPSFARVHGRGTLQG